MAPPATGTDGLTLTVERTPEQGKTAAHAASRPFAPRPGCRPEPESRPGVEGQQNTGVRRRGRPPLDRTAAVAAGSPTWTDGRAPWASDRTPCLYYTNTAVTSCCAAGCSHHTNARRWHAAAELARLDTRRPRLVLWSQPTWSAPCPACAYSCKFL